MAKKEKKKRSKVWRVIKYVLLSIMSAFLLVVIAGVVYIATLPEWGAFDASKLLDLEQTMLIYDKDDNKIANVYGKENRINVSIEDIPEHMKQAVLAIEDIRFYEHGGIDFRRLFGAIIADIKSGSLKEGGSTLSQQLIKMSHLTNEKTFTRKIKEAVLAIQLEQNFTKDEILEMYLNYNYFGNGAYGVEAASQAYFGKHVSEITVSEAATLAAILKSPTNYAPHTNPEKSLERRNLVISQMEKYGFLTPSQASQAKAEKVTVTENEQSYPYGYYTDTILIEAAQVLGITVDEVQSGGYRIYTSMDTALQEYLEQLNQNDALFPAAAADGVKCESAIVVLSPNSNEVVAMTGGRSHSARRSFNRATQLYRQPGSTIKPPLVFAPALDEGYTSSTILYDAPQDFNGYSPSNYGGTYNGYVSLKDVVAKSLNVPSVQILQDIGIQKAQKYASSVGIEFTGSDNNLAIALGGFTNGVTPMQLAGSYAPFSNGGNYTSPTCIRKIENSTGDEVYTNKYRSESVLSEDNAFIMTDMLQRTAETGTARRLTSVGIPIAAKTGTTGIPGKGENKDAWVVAYNPEYTISVWMGFDNTDEAHCLPQNITGGTLPTELAAKVFQYLYPTGTAPDFKAPDSVVEVKIDNSALINNQELVLATNNTKQASLRTDYFTLNSIYSLGKTAWLSPKTPSSIKVQPGANNSAVIQFAAPDINASYQVYRKENVFGSSKLLGEYPGGSNVRIWDDYVSAEGCYYYVVACRPSVSINGACIQSEPSQQVLYKPNGSSNMIDPPGSSRPDNNTSFPVASPDESSTPNEPLETSQPPKDTSQQPTPSLPTQSPTQQPTQKPTQKPTATPSPTQTPPADTKKPNTTIMWPGA
ncbi:PBP1A family penicillin-binding protein [Clostridia bacterium OttesenSCG-928-F22]|nr:PBP1A family penicillin-binding protein [Clostridia bacterium OttesenSCG-928-F22]